MKVAFCCCWMKVYWSLQAWEMRAPAGNTTCALEKGQKTRRTKRVMANIERPIVNGRIFSFFFCEGFSFSFLLMMVLSVVEDEVVVLWAFGFGVFKDCFPFARFVCLLVCACVAVWCA